MKQEKMKKKNVGVVCVQKGEWRIRGKEKRKRLSVLEVPILWRSGKGENKCKLGRQKTPWDEAPGPKEVCVQLA